ncbi:hypothetical protein GOV03_04315 [Candidatus Woesearchaeota archaeon]|nr:hypothetical protein [Candidatus Woesearchaeota archaeon]
MSLYKVIRNRVLILASAGLLALTLPNLCEPEQVTLRKGTESKRENSFEKIFSKSRQERLEEKLEQITRQFKRDDLSYKSFKHNDLSCLLAKENIDNDGIPDYVLLIGGKCDKEFPECPPVYYIEDSSELSGLGTVDTFLFYAPDEKGIKRVRRVEQSGIEITIAFYGVFKEREEPAYKKLAQEAKKRIQTSQENMKNANKAYYNIISGLELE